MHVTEKGISLLRRGHDGTFVGVIHDATMAIELFVASAHEEALHDECAGHRQLLEHKRIPHSGVRGFSFTVKAGTICTFYRNSVLNLNLPDYSISFDETDSILAELGVEIPISTDISVYP